MKIQILCKKSRLSKYPPANHIVGLIICGLALSFLRPTVVTAHPVVFKGAYEAYTNNQVFLSDHWLTASLWRKTALSARLMRMQMKESDSSVSNGDAFFEGAQVNHLLWRKNAKTSQSNVYLYGGAGHLNFANRDVVALASGVEWDFETRTQFYSLRAESMLSELRDDFYKLEGRIGFAPYEAEYAELASWFMIQAQWHPVLRKAFVVTPLARFFYRSVLWETGVSLQGDWMLNLMFHF